MRRVATDHAVVRLAKRRQSQRIRRCPVENKEDFALSFKKLAKGIGCSGRPGIVPIRRYMAPIGDLGCIGSSGTYMPA